MKNTLRSIVYTGIFLVPFIAFFVSPSLFFPFITGKGFAFRIIVEIIFAAWLLLALFDPRYRIKKTGVVIALGLFVAIVAIADIFGENFLKSFWSNFERMEGLITLLHLLAYVVVVGSVMKTKKLWGRLFNTTVIASVFMGLYALNQMRLGLDRLDGTLGNSTYLGVYMLLHIFLTLWLLYRTRKEKILVVLYMCALMLQVIVLYNTGTRGTVLGLLGGAFVSAIIVAFRGHGYQRMRKGAIGAVVVVLLLVAGFFGLKDTELVQDSPFLKRFADISLQDTTTQSRFIIWTEIAWNGFKERPLLGWGQDNFIHVFGKYYHPEMYKQEPWFDRAHNVFFDWAIAAGIVGLLGYLSLFGIALYYIWRRGDLFSLPEQALFTGMLGAYFIHNLFVFDHLVSYILFMTFLAFVHARLGEDSNTKGSVATTLEKYRHLIIGGGIIVGLFGIYFINVPSIYKARALIIALEQQHNGAGVLTSVHTQKGAAELPGVGTVEAREQLTSMVNHGLRMGGTPEVQLALLTHGVAAVEANIEADPTNSRPVFFAADFYRNTNQLAQAEIRMQEALSLSPKRPLFHLVYGDILFKMGRTDASLEAFKKGYELASKYELAQTQYAVALIRAGQEEKADSLIEDAFGDVLVYNPNLLRAYSDVGYDDRVLAIWQQQAEANPSDTQTRVFLAIAYVGAGQTETAIALLNDIIEDEEPFRQQGEIMIEQIRAGILQGF